jgi:hypothetical protein
MPETADMVIVAAAPRTLAAPLSQDPARSALLLEAGHAYAPDAFPREVLDAGVLADPEHNWRIPPGPATSRRAHRPRGQGARRQLGGERGGCDPAAAR